MHYVLENKMITKGMCLALKWLIIQVQGTATQLRYKCMVAEHSGIVRPLRTERQPSLLLG